MTGPFAAELRKLSTVRATWILTLVGLAFVGLSASLTIYSGFGDTYTGTAEQVADIIAAAGGNSAIVLVVALLSMTTEFRHGTIGRTLQLTPSRTRVLLAKLASGAVYGVVFFLGSLVVSGLLVGLGAITEGASPTFGAPVTEAIWQGVVALVLTALLGVAFGALVRAQVLAITVSLIWIFAVENLAVALLPDVGRWLPFQALNSLFLTDAQSANAPEGTFVVHEPLTALAIFLGYVAVFTLAAIVLMRKRDV